MNTFAPIFMHYVKRPLRATVNYLILIGIPLGIIMLNVVAITGGLPEGATLADVPGFVGTVAVMTLCFQFFSGEILHEFLNFDLRSELKWRLLAAPVSKATYIFAMASAAFVTTILQGFLIFALMVLVFGIQLGSPLIWLPVLVITAVMSQLVSVLVVLFTKTKKQAASVSMVVGFAIMATAGGLPIPRAIFPDVLFYNNPVIIGTRAMLYNVDHPWAGDNPWANIGMLAIMTAVLAVAIVIVSRRKAI